VRRRLLLLLLLLSALPLLCYYLLHLNSNAATAYGIYYVV